MTMTLPPALRLSCPPRFGTPRDPSRATLGPRVVRVAEMLGTPLMPWQAHVADVALEIDPETGLLAYQQIVLVVPRQSGKTVLLLCAMVHRAQGFGARQRVLYAAQDRNHAREKWEEEHVKTLEGSALRPLFTVRKSNGSEKIRWRNGSTHGITAATETAGHGDTLDLGVIDEAFAHVDARLEQGMSPTMITRPQPQIWIVSTAGTDKSVFLRGKVDSGRARCEAGVRRSSVAYFEWSAPTEADPEDPATWRGCMPALGFTQSEAAVSAQLELLGLAEFRRAFLNQWPDDIPVGWQVIGRDEWDPLVDAESEIVSRVAFAVATNLDRTWSAVAAAGLRLDGRLHVEVMAHEPGTDWVVPWLAERQLRWDPCATVIHASGPAGSLIADAEKDTPERAGLEILKPTGLESAHACGQLYDRVVKPKDWEPAQPGQIWEPSLRFMPNPALNAAMAASRKKVLADQWVWDRRTPGAELLEAVTLAGWGFGQKGHVEEQPFFASWR